VDSHPPARDNDKEQGLRRRPPAARVQASIPLALLLAAVALAATELLSAPSAVWLAGGLVIAALLILMFTAFGQRAAGPEQDAFASTLENAPAATGPPPLKRLKKRATVSGRNSLKPARLAGKRILLLSNDRHDQHGIQRHLDSWGAETRVCESSVRAFAALIEGERRHTPYHAVIVNQGQFDMDSRQFAISLRSDPALQALHLIHIGMPALASLVDQFYSLGYNRLLRTPLDKTLLFGALHGIAPQPPENEPQVVQLLDHYNGRGQSQSLQLLLAENDPNEQQRIRMILQRAGHRVFLVDDGARVLDAIDSHRFDLTIASYQLQEISGLETFKLYRFTRLDEAWIPFIMLLNSRSASAAQACDDAGVDAILVRPFTSRQLLDQVERVAQRHIEHPADGHGNNVSTIYGNSQAIVIDGLTLDGQRLEELEQLGKGREFLAELLGNFDRECQQFSRQVEEAIRQGGGRQLQDIGHTIKDGAGSLGMLDLYHIGVKFTRLPTDRLPDNIDKLLIELKQCCRDSHKALQHYLSKRDIFLES
jgi:two-component system sensor histidine kinase RpfC